jgi:hypothetical protein
MKVKLAVVGALTVAGLALGACGERPVEGTVTHKQYSAAYTYFTHPCIAYSTRTYRSGNSTYTSTSCVAYGLTPNYMPASYQICVDGVGKSGKKASGCWEVPPQEYARWHEGDHYGKAVQ